MRGQKKEPESGPILGSQIKKQEHEMKNTNTLHRALLAALVITGKDGFEKYLSSVQTRFNSGVPTWDEARKDFQTTSQSANLATLRGECSF